MTTLVDYTARFLNTVEAMDYTLDEIDDLTDRKVEAIEVDGDALARMIRTRRGTARFTEQEDPYLYITDAATFNLWGDVTHTDGDRRMAATGYTDGGDGLIADHVVDGRVEYGYFVPQSN